MEINKKIKNNISLAPLTTFKIGGKAKFFVEVKSEEELVAALNWAKEKEVSYFILGGGSNLLINDKNVIDLLIIKISYKQIICKNNLVSCGAGADLGKVVQTAIKNKLTGLEWALGIPGTIGGAVRGNAGAFKSAISDNVEKVKVFDCKKEKIVVLNKKQCLFSYKESLMKEDGNLILWEITLRLRKEKVEVIKKNCQQTLTVRKNHPRLPSAGCVFKNLSGEYVKEDSPELYQEAKDDNIIRNNLISTGWIISHTNLPGKVIGRAKISSEHANFIVNSGHAKAEDVILLISLIKQRVRTEYRLQLHEEIVYLGF